MGDMDQLKEMGLPVAQGAFGEDKDPLLGKGAMAVILNAMQTQLAKGNKILESDSPTLAAVGQAGITLLIKDNDWSATAADWEVTVSEETCTVNSVDVSADPTELDIDVPALSGAGVNVQMVIKAKKAGGTELETVGSMNFVTV